MSSTNKITAVALGALLSTGVMAQVPTSSSDPALNNGLNDILKGMQYQRDGADRKMNVFLLSTGSIPHSDVAYLGGKNYVTLNGAVELAKDGLTNRDENDYEDYYYDGGGLCVSGSGLSMASVIGAEQSNGRGIDGIVNASMYMARVAYSECGGASEWPVARKSDIIDALGDATRVFRDTPSNQVDIVAIGTPVDVTVCESDLGDAIAELINEDVTVIVPARSGIAECDGVIAVGSHNSAGGGMYSHDAIDVAVLGSRAVAISGTDSPSTENGMHLSVAAAAGMAGVIKQQMPSLTGVSIKKAFEHSAESISCADCGVGAANLLNALQLAEKVYAPTFTFSGALDDTGTNCLAEREFEAISQHVDICNIIVGKIDTPYAENGVEYNLRVLRRAVTQSPWEITSAERLFDYQPTLDHDALPIVDDASGQFEYAISACAETSPGQWFCPKVYSIDPSSTVFTNTRPDECN